MKIFILALSGLGVQLRLLSGIFDVGNYLILRVRLLKQVVRLKIKNLLGQRTW